MVWIKPVPPLAMLAAALFCAAPVLADDGPVERYRADLVPLNDSGVSGFVRLTLDQSDATMPTLRVRLFAENLPVSDDPDAFHGLRITGRFKGQDLFQENGPFFEGDGGKADLTRLPARLPTVASNDVNLDGFLSPREILPASGVAILNLTDPQSPSPESGVAPGTLFDPAAFPSGASDVIDLDHTYVFDLSDEDQARQFNNLLPLLERQILITGGFVPADAATDFNDVLLADGWSNNMPVAAAQVVPEPATAALVGMAMFGSVMAVTRRRRPCAR